MFVTHDTILSFLSNEINQPNNKVILIKDSNNLSLKELHDYLSNLNSSTKCFYEDLRNDSCYEPYFPFLSFIKQGLSKFCLNLSDFLESINIYPSHKDIFTGYISCNEAKRSEEIIPFDYKYEKNKLYQGLLDIFNKYSEESEVYVLLENINYMKYSTLEWLKWLVNNETNYRFKIILTITSYEYYMSNLQEEFERFIEIIEAKYSLLQLDNKCSELQYNSDKERDYFVDLLNVGENLFQFFDLDEALYCFTTRYKLTKKVDKIVVNKELEYVLTRLGDIYLLKEDFHNAYIYYDQLLNQAIELNDNHSKARVFQRLSMLEILRSRFNMAEKFAKNSYKIAVSIKDDYLKLKSYELLFWINEKGKYRTTIENLGFEEEFILLAKKYGEKNALAYFLTHNFNVLSFRGPCDQREDYYNEGHALAQKLKNENCILSAHLKTALVYAVNGYHNISKNYYEKVENLLIAMKDNFRLAQIYNGTGYYYLTAGKYEKANNYYNKSLQYLKLDWNFDEICMTLINKSINAMLVSDYVTAEKQLDILISVIKELKLDRLRLTTLSRIYGIIALNHSYLGNSYRSYSFLSKMQTVISFNKYSDDDDEYFLNNFTQGLLLKRKGLFNEAQKFLKQALYYINRIQGSLKCFYPKFILEYKELLLKCKKIEEAQKFETIGYEYCKQNNLLYYIGLFEKKECKEYHFQEYLSQITWIVEAAKQEQSIHSLNDKVDEINFINNFQEILTSSDDKENVINNSMILLENKFLIDYSLLIFYDNEVNRVIYNSNRKQLSDRKINELKILFDKYKNPIVLSKDMELSKSIQNIIEDQVKSLIYIPIIKDNKLKVFFLCVTKIDDDIVNNKIVLNDSNLRVINIVIKQLVEKIQKIEWQKKLIASVSIDMLTELYNRQYFYNKLSNLVNQSKKDSKMENEDVCLFYIDLDNFKYYNDTFGHTVGDSVLIWFGEILKSVTPEKSSAIRYGGDEFLLLVEQCDEEKAKQIGNKIYDNIEKLNGFKEKIIDMLKLKINIPKENLLSCSMGIRCTKLNKKFNTSEFIDSADKSLYEAKKTGKGRYVIF